MPNIKLILRVPRATSSVVPAAGNSMQVSVTKSNPSEGADKLEVEVLMEADDNCSSDGEDGLAHCAHRQEAGMLEEYKDNNQQLPGDEDYESEDDEHGCTSEVDIIHDAEWLAQQWDEEVSNSKDGSNDNNKSNKSSDKDNEGDANFIPKLQLGRKRTQDFMAVGDPKR